MFQQVKNSEIMLYDFIAVGAGPSNLSLAIQASQAPNGSSKNWIILEKNDEVRWHPGMMLPGARLDTHFAKDLISMVDPTSRFSFLNYLSVHNKLEAFLNCGSSSPFRADFDKYVNWAANELSDNILTSKEVTRIESSEDGNFILHVTSSNGTERMYRARNVILGAGGKPKSICGLDLRHQRVIHSSEFLYKTREQKTFDKRNKLLIVGGGQSAAELINFSLTETDNDISCVIDDFGLTSKEGTSFVNESYNGDFIDRFYSMNQDMRDWFISKRKNMNYGVVDEGLINELYNNCYHAENFENRKIEFLQFSRMTTASAGPDNVDVEIRNRETGKTYRERFDYVVLASGYDLDHSQQMLYQSNLNFIKDSKGRPRVNRDYSISCNPPCANGCKMACSKLGKIYLNGNVSSSHGPAGDVLSVIAHRSRDILNSIQKYAPKKYDFELKSLELT